MSEVNWNLGGPGFDAMQVLQAAGQTYPQQQQREQVQYARQQDQVQNQQRQQQIDRTYLDKMDTRQREEAKQQVEQLGQFALLADTPEKWDGYVDQYVKMGHPEAEQFRGQFSPQLRQVLIANAGEAKAYLDQQKVDYKVIPEGGYLQGFDQQGQPLGDVATQPRAPDPTPTGGNGDLSAQARAAIAAGADPAAVRARMLQLQGGAGPQAPRSFP